MALRLIARVPDEHYLQNAPVGIGLQLVFGCLYGG